MSKNKLFFALCQIPRAKITHYSHKGLREARNGCFALDFLYL